MQDVLLIVFFVLLSIGFVIIQILFLVTLYNTMNNVPEEKRYFPSWFIWMMLVPFVYIVFMWMMLPWGVGRTLKNAVAGNPEAEKRADTIFNLGLAQLIISLVAGLFAVTTVTIIFISLPFVVAYWVTWIIYWIKVSRFNRDYLKPQIVITNKSI